MSQQRRYPPEAYEFLRDALAMAQKQFPAASSKFRRSREEGESPTAAEVSAETIHHVTGQQLLQGVRKLGMEQFGMLAPTVFRSWGIDNTLDFGRLVYSLIEAGVWKKSPSDRLEDFANGFDFDEVFVRHFRFEHEENDEFL